ncbi:MAG: transporter substrate-binding domain-containing protein [Alphaproteobacteria bacterium]
MDRRDVLSLGLGAGALAAAGSIAAPALAQAQGPAAGTSLKRILDRGHIIVGTRSTTIGFGFKDAKGDLVGFDIDLAREVAKGLFNDPNKVQFEIFPGGAERVPALVSGRVDIVVSQFSVFESRAQVLEFSLPYCNADFSAIVRANSPYKVNKDLAGKTVTTRQGDELKALIVNAIPNANVTMYPNFSDAFLAFRQGRAEAFFNDSAPARYIIREFAPQFRVILDKDNPLDVNQYSIGIKQGDQVLLNYINWALARMRLEGRLQAIHRRWLESEDLVPYWARSPI